MPKRGLNAQYGAPGGPSISRHCPQSSSPVPVPPNRAFCNPNPRSTPLAVRTRSIPGALSRQRGSYRSRSRPRRETPYAPGGPTGPHFRGTGERSRARKSPAEAGLCNAAWPGGNVLVQELAPRDGFEPPAKRLTAACSTAELPGIRVALYSNTATRAQSGWRMVEARAGIEPTYKDLQSSASPLCHRAPAGGIPTGPRRGAQARTRAGLSSDRARSSRPRRPACSRPRSRPWCSRSPSPSSRSSARRRQAVPGRECAHRP